VHAERTVAVAVVKGQHIRASGIIGIHGHVSHQHQQVAGADACGGDAKPGQDLGYFLGSC